MKKAKSVIEIWLWGGPSQLETFDPKPDASPDYNNGLKAIPTNAPGLSIHEWWPELAKCGNLFSVIRSMTHPHAGHETATYLMQTGRNPGGGDVFPAIGTVTAMMKTRDKSYQGDLPPYVILTQAKGRFSEVGFLGDRYAPLVTGGNPNGPQFVVDGIVPPGGLSPEEMSRRFDLLKMVDHFGEKGRFKDYFAAGEKARHIIEGSAAKTFDLKQESPETHAHRTEPAGRTPPRRIRRAVHHREHARVGFAQAPLRDDAESHRRDRPGAGRAADGPRGEEAPRHDDRLGER